MNRFPGGARPPVKELLFRSDTLCIHNRAYCANNLLNSKRTPRTPPSFSLFLKNRFFFSIPSSESGVEGSRRPSCLMKDSVCSRHLDICRCFQAAHCLVGEAVRSRRPPRATGPDAAARDALSSHNEGTVWQRGIRGCVEIDGGRRIGGWDWGGGGAPLALQMMLPLEAKNDCSCCWCSRLQ